MCGMVQDLFLSTEKYVFFIVFVLKGGNLHSRGKFTVWILKMIKMPPEKFLELTHCYVFQVAISVVQKLQQKAPQEFCLSSDVELEIRKEEEGSESVEFFKGIGGSNRHLYVSLAEDKKDNSARLFHLTSLSGTFSATEVAAPCRNSKLTVPFPFQQSHLYEASQPGKEENHPLVIHPLDLIICSFIMFYFSIVSA